MYAPSQSETTLQCSNISHWLGTNTDWSLLWTILFILFKHNSIGNELELSLSCSNPLICNWWSGILFSTFVTLSRCLVQVWCDSFKKSSILLIHWPLGKVVVISKYTFQTHKLVRHSLWNCLRWMSKNLTDEESILVQVMTWCPQATCHYLSQCWSRSVSP